MDFNAIVKHGQMSQLNLVWWSAILTINDRSGLAGFSSTILILKSLLFRITVEHC